MSQSPVPPTSLKVLLTFVGAICIGYFVSGSIVPEGFLALVAPKGPPTIRDANLPLLQEESPTPCANNIPPVAVAMSDPSSQASLGVPVLFDGLGSLDQGGSITNYDWDFGDATNGSGPTPAHVYTTTGAKTIVLRVTDNCGAVDSTTIILEVVVSDPCNNNVLPVAAFSAPTAGSVNYPQRFNAFLSTDSDGTIATYSWDFGDGESGTGITPIHTYLTVGTYQVTLTVNDNCGGSRASSRSIEITPTNSSISEGFSRQFPGVRIWGPTAADVDGNGHSEIFAFGINGLLYGLDSTGNDLPNFPVDLVALSGQVGAGVGLTPQTRVTPMTVADLDNDGLSELLPIIKINTGSTISNRLLVLRYDGTLADFWPSGGRDLGNFSNSIPAVVVSDLDRDGNKELIVKGFESNPDNTLNLAKLFIFRLNGELFNEHYPIVKTSGDDINAVSEHNLHGSPVVGDLDGDKKDEIVLNFGELTLGTPGTSELDTTRMHAINPEDASELSGWPREYHSMEMSRLSPVLGDVDNNGSLNVIFVGHELYDPPFGVVDFHRAVVYVLEPDGSDLLGWPQRPYINIDSVDRYCIGDTWIHSPSAADLDHDGNLEIVFICSFNAGTGLTFIYESSGESHPPVTMEHLHSHEPWNWLVADMETGGDLELVYATEGDNDGTIPTGDDIYIYRSDLNLLPGMPIGLHPEWNRQGFKSMPATIADLQRDGQSDLVHIKSYDFHGSELRVVDFGGQFNSSGSWPTFHHDNSRTGLAD